MAVAAPLPPSLETAADIEPKYRLSLSITGQEIFHNLPLSLHSTSGPAYVALCQSDTTLLSGVPRLQADVQPVVQIDGPIQLQIQCDHGRRSYDIIKLSDVPQMFAGHAPKREHYESDESSFLSYYVLPGDQSDLMVKMRFHAIRSSPTTPTDDQTPAPTMSLRLTYIGLLVPLSRCEQVLPDESQSSLELMNSLRQATRDIQDALVHRVDRRTIRQVFRIGGDIATIDDWPTSRRHYDEFSLIGDLSDKEAQAHPQSQIAFVQIILKAAQTVAKVAYKAAKVTVKVAKTVGRVAVRVARTAYRVGKAVVKTAIRVARTVYRVGKAVVRGAVRVMRFVKDKASRLGRAIKNTAGRAVQTLVRRIARPIRNVARKVSRTAKNAIQRVVRRLPRGVRKAASRVGRGASRVGRSATRSIGRSTKRLGRRIKRRVSRRRRSRSRSRSRRRDRRRDSNNNNSSSSNNKNRGRNRNRDRSEVLEEGAIVAATAAGVAVGPVFAVPPPILPPLVPERGGGDGKASKILPPDGPPPPDQANDEGEPQRWRPDYDLVSASQLKTGRVAPLVYGNLAAPQEVRPGESLEEAYTRLFQHPPSTSGIPLTPPPPPVFERQIFKSDYISVADALIEQQPAENKPTNDAEAAAGGGYSSDSGDSDTSFGVYSDTTPSDSDASAANSSDEAEDAAAAATAARKRDVKDAIAEEQEARDKAAGRSGHVVFDHDYDTKAAGRRLDRIDDVVYQVRKVASKYFDHISERDYRDLKERLLAVPTKQINAYKWVPLMTRISLEWLIEHTSMPRNAKHRHQGEESSDVYSSDSSGGSSGYESR